MIRVNVYISRPQQEAVKRAAERRGISAAEVIRTYIDRGIAADFEKLPPAAQRAEQKAVWAVMNK
jgi:hypothetical protein